MGNCKNAISDGGSTVVLLLIVLVGWMDIREPYGAELRNVTDMADISV